MNNTSYSLQEMIGYAHEAGGRCLEHEIILDWWDKLKWRCKRGHVFEMLPSLVKQGGWCPQCHKKEGRKQRQMDRLKEIAESRGGRVLSNEYINNETKLQFECKKGHVWETVPSTILRKNMACWCPSCAHVQPKSIAVLNEFAAKKGGKCLSEVYFNTNSKVKWQCKEGHIWEATPGSVVSTGTWCPECKGLKRLTIGQMKEYGMRKGGKCLSDKYTNNYTKLLWQCHKGHEWEASANAVKRGQWCPQCYRDSRGIVTKMT